MNGGLDPERECKCSRCGGLFFSYELVNHICDQCQQGIINCNLVDNIEKLYQVLIKPKGLRLRLLKWLYPEITDVADALREYYWSK